MIDILIFIGWSLLCVYGGILIAALLSVSSKEEMEREIWRLQQQLADLELYSKGVKDEE